MSFLLPFLLLVVFMACVGLLYTEGMWGNAIHLINVVTAALLATNFWEPLARFLEENVNGSFTYFWDFIALWALFCTFLIIFRTLTGFASRVKVKFLGIVNRAGSGFLAACVGWVMVCFTTMTLHTAPLKRDFLFGGFRPGEKMFVGMAPDQQWLSFVEGRSRGSFSRSASEEDLQENRYPPGPNASERQQKLCVFDGNHEFIPKYAARRASLDKGQQLRVSEGSAPQR